MISHMAEPVAVRLSGDDGGSRVSDLGQKQNSKIYKLNFFWIFFFLSTKSLYQKSVHFYQRQQYRANSARTFDTDFI